MERGKIAGGSKSYAGCKDTIKVARSGRNVGEKRGPKPGLQNRQFCGDTWAHRHSSNGPSCALRVSAEPSKAIVGVLVELILTI